MKVLKKFWVFIVAIFAAIFAGIIMSKSGQRREAAKANKKEIEKKIDDINKEKDILNKKIIKTKDEIKNSKEKVKKIEEEIEKTNNKNKAVKKAIDHLRNIGKKDT